MCGFLGEAPPTLRRLFPGRTIPDARKSTARLCRRPRPKHTDQRHREGAQRAARLTDEVEQFLRALPLAVLRAAGIAVARPPVGIVSENREGIAQRPLTTGGHGTLPSRLGETELAGDQVLRRRQPAVRARGGGGSNLFPPRLPCPTTFNHARKRPCVG